MSQDDSPDLAAQAGKVAPEAVALRAQPRPVTRLNRRTLAILVGVLSVAVLGATIWSLQPHRRGTGEQTELYNVDRVSKSEGLDGLPADYSKLPPKVPELGPPLPGDLGPAIVKSQQPVTPAYAPPGHDPADAWRKEADAAQEAFVANKIRADEEHKLHIKNIRQVHDYDKIISGMRQKARKAKRKEDETSAKEEAEKIFDRFKAGEKLSTEDLMALQKSGYL